jgi:hypothetical protein
MSREQVFDSEIKKFFDMSVKILETHQKNQIVSNDNHTLRNLQRYRIVYNMTEPQNHIPYFQKVFRTYRDDLLNVLKDDKWLLDENIVIQFGEELEDPELRKRSEKRKIELSSIYKTACQLKKTTEESLKGLPDSVRESSQELIYPEIFLLHLYRIFYSIYPQNKDLLKVIQTLEKDLGVTTPNKKLNNPLLDITENAKKILGSGNGKNLLESLLPDLKLPSNEEMNQKLSQAMKDPVVSETIGMTMNNVMNARNLGEGIGVALKSLENPKFMEGLMKAVNTLIPPETLQSITKSTEQLKDNGEIKNALSQLGLPGEIDISQMLSGKGGGLDLLKSFEGLNLSQVVGSLENSTEQLDAQQESVVEECENGVCMLTSSEENLTTNETVSSDSVSCDATASGSVASGSASSLVPNDMLEMFKNPELLQMFQQFQKTLQPSSAQGSEEKSLIDF